MGKIREKAKEIRDKVKAWTKEHETGICIGTLALLGTGATVLGVAEIVKMNKEAKKIAEDTNHLTTSLIEATNPILAERIGDLPKVELPVGELVDFSEQNWYNDDEFPKLKLAIINGITPQEGVSPVTMADIGKIGEAFIGAEGTNITAETPINLVMDIQDVMT